MPTVSFAGTVSEQCLVSATSSWQDREASITKMSRLLYDARNVRDPAVTGLSRYRRSLADSMQPIPLVRVKDSCVCDDVSGASPKRSKVQIAFMVKVMTPESESISQYKWCFVAMPRQDPTIPRNIDQLRWG